MVAEDAYESTLSNNNEFEIKVFLILSNALHISIDKDKISQTTVDIPKGRFEKLIYCNVITLTL